MEQKGGQFCVDAKGFSSWGPSPAGAAPTGGSSQPATATATKSD